jgi:hypothetical protein
MLNSMASAYAGELWMQLPREGIYSRPIMDEARGTSENGQLTGGVLSGHHEHIKWLPVGLRKVWWSQRDLNPCLSLESAF